MANLKRFIANKGLDNNSNTITNVLDPVSAQDAATKAYADALIPTQTGNSGKYLTTNGTTVSWGTISASAGTVTSVAVSGGTTGLTTSGGPVTSSGTITLAGTLALANGGTGATTQSAAATAILPTQTGNSGKYLTTNGTTVSWASETYLGTVTSVAVSGGTTGLTTSGGPITSSGTITLAGTLAVVNGGTGATTQSAAATAILPTQTGNSGKYLTTDGTTSSWSTPVFTQGGVGAVMIAYYTTNAFIGYGATTAGANLTYLNQTMVGCSTVNTFYTMGLTGTWKSLGNIYAVSSSAASYVPSYTGSLTPSLWIRTL